jgi:hypothetical protein
MLKRLRYAMVLMSALPLQVGAQECVDLARVMSREVQKSASQNQIDIVKKASFCSSKYELASSDQRAQIQASYELFSGGASGSSQQISEKQEQECGGQYGSYWASQINSDEVNRVSTVGADVVRACLQQQSFRLHSLEIQGDGIVASFTNGAASPATINSIAVVPEEVATCSASYDGPAVNNISGFHGQQLKENHELSLHCTRKFQIEGNVKHYPGGIIAVSTQQLTASVPLVEYAQPPITATAAEAINTEINSLKTSIAAFGIVNGTANTCDWVAGNYEQICQGSCPTSSVVIGGSCEVPTGTAGLPLELHESTIRDAKWNCHYLNATMQRASPDKVQLQATAVCLKPVK